LDRRHFLKASTLAAGATMLPSAIGEMTKHSHNPQPQTLRILPLNRGWRFSPTLTEGDFKREFDDSSFARVVIPHTNKVLPWHGFDEKSYEFTSVYRRRFKLPQAARGQRVFVDFEGAMTASTVFINGEKLGEYKGGYTPFSFELTSHVDWDGDNVLVVHLDSSERPDIPPFGYEVDYLTFGGIYREMNLRIVPATYLENIFARPVDVLSEHPSVEVKCFLDSATPIEPKRYALSVELRDGERVISKASVPWHGVAHGTEPLSQTVVLTNLTGIKLWDLKAPTLYTVHVQLLDKNVAVDRDSRRIGFREAKFTDRGFSLNGKIIKLRGLDRHQTFPFVGQAMPARVQRRDARILRNSLKCNIVRTSHYPQSRHFLDACDEVGLLVLEEITGWQHIGDGPWKDIAVDNVRRMIRRDWNHPSIILWGVRINESKDDHNFYLRTNTLAHALDASRQTGGIRSSYTSELLEDVYTNNDFGFPLQPPNHPLYLNTEFVGHTFPTRSTDNSDRLREHTLRHARIHDQLASNPGYAGGLGWCAFDYNTHANFGSGDRICYHGVSDIFREPKPAAGFYKSQCDPEEEVVLEPAYHWARNDENTGFTTAVVCSNCDHLKFYLDTGSGFKLLAEADPDRKEFAHLKYAPFTVPFRKEQIRNWGDLRIDGFLNDKLVISKTYSGKGVDQKFFAVADDHELVADGADTTRVVVRVTDEFEQIRPIANDPIVFEISGPATIIGDNPFALVGGTGAIWIRALETPGTVILRAKHPRLGTQQIEIKVLPAEAEMV